MPTTATIHVATAPTEDKHDKFVRLVEPRVARAIKAIELIGNLSSRSSYTYSDEEAGQVFEALETALATCKSRFVTKHVEVSVFKLQPNGAQS